MAYYNPKEMRIELSEDDKDFLKEQNGKQQSNGSPRTPVADSIMNWVKTGKTLTNN
jgi:hypothetical protein